MPERVREQIEIIGAKFFHIGIHFDYTADSLQWSCKGLKGQYYSLPHPALRGAYQLNNASLCLAALDTLRERLPVTSNDVRRGLLEVSLIGRFQVLPGRPVTILDVAHNPAAAHVLADNLGALGVHQYTYAVIGMLKDKDIIAVGQAVSEHIDEWLVASTHTRRGASAAEIVQTFIHSGIAKEGKIHSFPDTVAAYRYARERASENDRICVFGSFYTVGAVLAVL